MLWQVATVVALLLAGLLIWQCLRWRRSYPYFTWPQQIIYGFGRFMARVRWRAEIPGSLPVPEGQGAIIVCNHRGPFDPAFIQLATNRVVHWMVAREYCEHWSIAWFFRTLQAIPVGRGGVDTAATKAAIRYAQAGDLVGLLPEGRINTTDQLLLPGRPGAALIALKVQVPVIPCYITGSPLGKTIFRTLFKRGRAKLVIGKPLDLSPYYGREREKEVLAELTLWFLREIAKLAGEEDYQPSLAGRRWMPQEER